MVSIRPKHLKRYQTVAWLLIKHGRSEMVKKSGLADLIDGVDDLMGRTDLGRAEDLARDLEAHGPTYIKLGQLLSTRVDLLPKEYIAALIKLQDDVKHEDFTRIRQQIESSLGTPLANIFRTFDENPLASASISQVHRAILHTGETVVVKVRRPDVRDAIIDDLDAFEDLAKLLEDHTEIGRIYNFRQIMSTFKQTLLDELNFVSELESLTRLQSNLKEFQDIIIPKPYKEFSSDCVLTMDYIDGVKITNQNMVQTAAARQQELANTIFRAYLHQIFIDGFFHADPHPGNMLFTADGKIAILDLGMVIHLTPGKQEHLVKLLLAVSEGLGELAADITISMGYPKKGFTYETYRNDISMLVANNYNASLDKLNLGHLILELNVLAGKNHFQLASEILALSKILLSLDKSLLTLNPEFNLSQAIRHEASHLIKKRMTPEASIASFYNAMSESKELASHLPFRLNRILSLLAHNKLRFEVDAIDEKLLISGIQKIANRITAGLLLGSLILGASIAMHVETDFQFLGYPVIAFVLFVLAAAGGIVLAVDILFRDR
jgi:predicted unusual protein kinase regulating ubiquinone biosynthesis (AarF/ABC1/UbiB family)